MRTKTLLAAAAMLAAGFASSLAQSNVYSLNVVGYVNKVIAGGGPNGSYTAVANPLNAATNTIGALLSSLPSGAAVLKWNGVDDYDIYDKVGANFVPNGNASLAPGEGVLIYLLSGSVTNTFVGEVLQGNLTNAYAAGLTMSGNKVPDSGPVSSMQLTNVPSGSALLKWNFALQDFDIFDRVGANWIPATPTLDVGESFFMSAISPFNWVRNFTVQ
jgi:hypothetical protein